MKRISSIFLILTLALTFSTLSFGQRNKNPYANIEAVVIVDEKNVYDPAQDTRSEELHFDGSVSSNFSAYVAKLPTISLPYEVSERTDRASFRTVSTADFNAYFDIVNGHGNHILVEPSEPNAQLYVIGKLANTPDNVHALLFYAYDGQIYQYTKIITFDESGNPISHQNVQYAINDGQGGTKQATKMTCRLNTDNTMSCVTYEEQNGEMKQTSKEGSIYRVNTNGKIEEVFSADLGE